jgi:hypothetical protein
MLSSNFLDARTPKKRRIQAISSNGKRAGIRNTLRVYLQHASTRLTRYRNDEHFRA